MAYVVIAIAVLPMQITRQGREYAEAGESQQSAIRHLIEAVAIGIVSLQPEPAYLFGRAGLKAGIVAARIRAEFVDAAESLVGRLVVCEGSKAAVTHGLIAVQLHLIDR